MALFWKLPDDPKMTRKVNKLRRSRTQINNKRSCSCDNNIDYSNTIPWNYHNRYRRFLLPILFLFVIVYVQLHVSTSIIVNTFGGEDSSITNVQDTAAVAILPLLNVRVSTASTITRRNSTDVVATTEPTLSTTTTTTTTTTIPSTSDLLEDENIDTTTTVTFHDPSNNNMMSFDTMMGPNKHYYDSYSGMWWVRNDIFIQHWNSINDDSCEILEDSTFDLYKHIGPTNIYMTRDWFDFCVEHLSHYFKSPVFGDSIFNFMSFHNKIIHYINHTTTTIYQQQQQQQQQQKQQRSPYTNIDHESQPFYHTLAILPMYLTTNRSSFVCGPDIPIESFYDNEVKRNQCWYMYAVSATLTSLWHVGIRRVIIPTNFIVTPPILLEAIRIFRNSNGIGRNESSSSMMEIVHVNVTENINPNVFPCNALDHLKRAMDGSMFDSELFKWLGPFNQRHQYRYIYFSEPDLILHTRLSSLHLLQQTIDDGKVIAAHRFQPLLHAADFPDGNNNNNVLNEFIPNYGNFSNFIDLNIQDSNDSCCDAGNAWPGYDNYPSCNNFFHICGYWNHPKNIQQAYQYHERLIPYPRIRIQDGINTFVVQEHGRICIPQKGDGTTCSTKSRP